MKAISRIVFTLSALAAPATQSLAAGQSASPPNVSPSDHVGLRELWQGCVAAAVREMDDHISPASDIATGVQSSCQREYDAFNRSFNFPPEMYRQIDDDRFKRTKELATMLVLQIRAIDRKKQGK